jgi:hypothetical protein
MKLYKYVPLASARAILASSTLGFRQPVHFNDPFDRPVAIPVPTENVAQALFAQIGADAKSTIWETNYAVLSLTRSVANALMWAHYADSHRGVVLEIDAVAAGFADLATNFIPAHFGSVIYTKRFSDGPYLSKFEVGVTVGQTHHFVLEHYEKWQRLFLTKPLDWAYEEEVRVVKCVHGVLGQSVESQSGVVSVGEVAGAPLYCFAVPDAAITAVIMGVRTTEQDRQDLKAARPELDLRDATLNRRTYSVGQKAPPAAS